MLDIVEPHDPIEVRSREACPVVPIIMETDFLEYKHKIEVLVANRPNEEMGSLEADARAIVSL